MKFWDKMGMSGDPRMTSTHLFCHGLDRLVLFAPADDIDGAGIQLEVSFWFGGGRLVDGLPRMSRTGPVDHPHRILVVEGKFVRVVNVPCPALLPCLLNLFLQAST